MRYTKISTEQSIQTKDWAAGSAKSTDHTEWLLINGKLVQAEISYADALAKCFDEVIVNALDHLIRQWQAADHKLPKKASERTALVSRIDAKFDLATTRITIANDGEGVPVKYLDEYAMYVPQLIFGNTWAGSNNEPDPRKIIGGTNGIGGKIANIMSREYTVETSDGTNFYFQRWTSNMGVVEKPLIIDLRTAHGLPAERANPHTKITFIPDWIGTFKYAADPDEQLKKNLNSLFYTRTVYAAIYANSINAPAAVYYNGAIVEISQFEQLGALLYDNVVSGICGKLPRGAAHGETAVKQGKGAEIVLPQYEWQVSVGIGAPKLFDAEAKPIPSITKYRQTSIVNGIIVPAGKHLDHICDQIIAGVKEKITKTIGTKTTFKESLITSNIHIFACCKVPNVSWADGQRKEKLTVVGASQQFAPYTFDKKFIDTIAAHLCDVILASLGGDKKSKKREFYDKYTPAKFAGDPTYKSSCFLLLPEGDSAKSMCADGLTSNAKMSGAKKTRRTKAVVVPTKTAQNADLGPQRAPMPPLGFEFYGIFTLGGVIPNFRRKSKVIANGEALTYLMDDKAAENKFWKPFCGITGLSKNYRYDPNSPTYAAEMAELKYAGIIGVVDQDLDGVGKIFGLILNLFEHFWPHLIAAGFVMRFATPISRAYPSVGRVVEFYSKAEFEAWNAARDQNAKFSIKYYKGLASHEDAEVENMFKNFERNLFVYSIVDRAAAAAKFHIYYDTDASLRKIELAGPDMVVGGDLATRQMETKTIDVIDHLTYETRVYERADLHQKLWSAIDGMNESGRKILDGSIKKFAKLAKPIKVAQLAGFISEHENYHHGQASLESSITGKAFVCTGGVQLPQLQPFGNFGSRGRGGDDAGQPRYINTKLNKRLTSLLYPVEDYYILPFTFDDGKRGEPKHFMPILPMAILESAEMPSHGWKIAIWARDVIDIIAYVRSMIASENAAPPLPIRYFTHGYVGQIREIDGKHYSYGNFELDDRTITVTELPLRTWHDNYFESLTGSIKDKKSGKETNGKPFLDIVNCFNHSGKNTIKIELKLTPDGLDQIRASSAKKDPAMPLDAAIVKALNLRTKLNENLNYMGELGEVLEFKDIRDIIQYWFARRKLHYATRIERQRIIIELKIKMMEEIIRYVAAYDELKIRGLKRVDAEKILAANNFLRFNKSLLQSPKFTPNDQLVAAITSDVITEDESEEIDDEESDKKSTASYLYLLNTTDLQRTKESHEKRNEQLAELKAMLTALNEKAAKGNFIGSAYWLEELDAIEKVIIEGRETSWMFGENAKMKFE